MKKRISTLSLAFILSAHASWVGADSLPRADNHAPIGVMVDHSHHKDEWMVSYRFMSMFMEDIIDDDNTIDTSEVVSPTGLGYMVSPVEMTMNMHMFGVMYAPTDKLTLSVMGGFLDSEMDHITRPGGAFTSESDGVSDTKLGAIYQLSKQEHVSLVFNAMLSIPTGDIDQTGMTPMSQGNPVTMPYPMQLGSGTYDLTSGFTFYQLEDKWSWGSQALYTHRLGESDNDYTLGDKFHITAWTSYLLHPDFSASGRLNYQFRDNIDGADPRLNPNRVFTANPNLYEKEQLDILLGANWKIGSYRVAFEVGVPVWYWADGPQLETQYSGTLGLQYAF